MTLHLSPDFEPALTATAQHLGLAEEIVEKDYWVTVVLRALADSPYRTQLVFKGGTALSKAYGLIERFSEDVDLAIAGTEGWTKTRIKNLMNAGAKHITQGFEEEFVSGVTVRGSHFRKTIHRFPAVILSGLVGEQFRGGTVLLEVNAFAKPYPTETRLVQAYVGQFLAERGEVELLQTYNLAPFPLVVLALERTLTEKVLALVRAGYATDPLRELRAKIRHVYDLHLLLQRPELQAFLESTAFTDMLVQVQADDARNQEFQGEWAARPLAEAALFSDVGQLWAQLLPTYYGTFKQLVYGKLPDASTVAATLKAIGLRLR